MMLTILCSHVCSHHVHRLVATPTNAQQAETSALGVYLTARDRAKRLGGSRAMPHGASATSVAMCMCQCTRDARKYDKTRKLSIKRVVSTILSSLFNSPEQLIDYRFFFRFEGGYLQLIEKLLPTKEMQITQGIDPCRCRRPRRPREAIVMETSCDGHGLSTGRGAEAALPRPTAAPKVQLQTMKSAISWNQKFS